MPDFDQLLQTVRTRSAIRDPDEAQVAISAVASSLAVCLGDPEREALAGPATDDSGEVRLNAADLVEEVRRRTGWEPERARYATQAVLSSLAEHDPHLRQAVLTKLPEAAALFTPPGAPA